MQPIGKLARRGILFRLVPARLFSGIPEFSIDSLALFTWTGVHQVIVSPNKRHRDRFESDRGWPNILLGIENIWRGRQIESRHEISVPSGSFDYTATPTMAVDSF